ncbi:MAG: NAD-dependent epimerase/dehydratase family protein [Alphaproteobacteria bacterium]|nr:NAD-dependent epimerase/dehydratase family protein [Alphaproteobacteria bacterium]
MADGLSLVTGGAGFIGRHLVARLRAEGRRVRVLELRDPGDLGCEVVVGSITDRAAVERAVAGATVVYHLAANPDLWAARKAVFDEVNRVGTEIVIAAARHAGVTRFVYTSTESILKGRARMAGGRPQDETVTRRLEDMPGPYTRSKFLAERAALAAAAEGFPLVVVNPTLPIGPGDIRITPPTRMILDFVNGATPAYMDCELNMIDVRDVAAGHVLAADKGRVGERYILGNINLPLARLLAILGDLTGLAMPKRRVPYWVALPAAIVSEFVADHITKNPPKAPVTGVRLCRSPMIFDSSKAVAELGLPQTPIETALADAIRWMAATGLLRRTPTRPL